MRMQLHDEYYTFDYVMAVNAIFDRLVEEHGDEKQIAKHLGMSQMCIHKFFQYKPVSMPTFLALTSAASVCLMEFVVKHD